MSKLKPEDLNVTSFETVGDEGPMRVPPICIETVSRCMGDCDSFESCLRGGDGTY